MMPLIRKALFLLKAPDSFIGAPGIPRQKSGLGPLLKPISSNKNSMSMWEIDTNKDNT